MKKFKRSMLVASLSVVGLSQAYATVENSSAADLLRELDNLAQTNISAMTAQCDAPAYEIEAASSEANFNASFGPANTIDGDLSTDSRWSSDDSRPELILDLGSSEVISGVNTAWYRADVRTAFFDVQTSNNASTWTTVVSGGSVSGTQGLVSFEFTPSEARYVRIIGAGNSASSWTSLIEAEVFGCSEVVDPGPGPTETEECAGDDNLAISRAGSTSDSSRSFGPANVLDGDTSPESRWSSNGIGNSLILDLGQSSTVTEIAASFYRGDEREAYFDVRTSEDSSNWTTVLSQATASGSLDLITFDVADSTARYVEIIGQGNSTSNWNSITEVNIFGCGEVRENTPFDPGPTVEPGGGTGGGVVIEPTPPGGGGGSTGGGNNRDVNAVFNGTFENNLSGWSQVEPATGSGESYSGGNAGKVSSSGALSQTIFLIPESRYEVSAFLQGDPTLGVRVNGRTFSAEGPDNGSTYEQVSFEFDSGNARTAELFVQASSSSESQRVDNVEVLQISGGDGSIVVDPNSVFDFTIWDVEGENPVQRDGTLSFDALEQCVVTPNGNGCRHEVKVLESERFGLTEQYEFFSAEITANLSDGSETIVAQHHPEETGTLAALYLSDTQDRADGVENGVARDGVFDVFATVRRPGGGRDNETVVFGTVRNGQAFEYEVINDHGEMIITMLGTTVRLQSADSSESYFKFGNYLQARDPVSLVRQDLDKPLGPEDRQNFLDYYRSKGITESVVDFRNINYSRTID